MMLAYSSQPSAINEQLSVINTTAFHWQFWAWNLLVDWDSSQIKYIVHTDSRQLIVADKSHVIWEPSRPNWLSL